MRIRPGYLLTAGAFTLTLALAACTSSNSNSASPATSTTNAGVPSSSPEAGKPTSLPTVTDEKSVEKVQRDLINLAARFAVNVPTQDRHPKIVTVKSSACGLTDEAVACPDWTNPIYSEVVIYINPGVAWNDYQHPIRWHDPNAGIQNWVLEIYAEYLSQREFQRSNPDTLDGHEDDAAFTRATQTRKCMSGKIFGGLRYGMSEELAQWWLANRTHPQGEYFDKGTAGAC